MERGVAIHQTPPSSLPQDVATVETFWVMNGGYILNYQNAAKRHLTAGEAMTKPMSKAQRTEVVAAVQRASADMKKYKALMVDVHKNPEDWTVEDLQKLKIDPKSAEMFKALVRIRDAKYGDMYSDVIKDYLDTKLRNIMRDNIGEDEKVMSKLELDRLMLRVQQVAGRAATPAK